MAFPFVRVWFPARIPRLPSNFLHNFRYTTGIRAILAQTSDLIVIGETTDGIEVQQMVADLRPQILLLDLRMPNLSPVKIEKWVRENYPETNTLILTQHDRDAYLAKMIGTCIASKGTKPPNMDKKCLMRHSSPYMLAVHVA